MTEGVFRRRSFLLGARGRLLSFNLLSATLTLSVGLIAIFGFHNAGRLLTEMQQHTLTEMNSAMAVGVKTAKVATSTTSLAQVSGAMEYQSESSRLRQALKALRDSLSHMAASSLARQQPELISQISTHADELQQSVGLLLDMTRKRHFERHTLLGLLYQAQFDLERLDALPQDQWPAQADSQQLDRLLDMALPIPASPKVLEQLVELHGRWSGQLGDLDPIRRQQVMRLLDDLAPIAALSHKLENSDLAITYHSFRIRALVNLLDQTIGQYVQLVTDSANQRAYLTQDALSTGSWTIALFALLAVIITALAGRYIYRNLGVNLTAIADAMTRLTRGERTLGFPALKRQDELGELARAFEVFARNAVALEQVTELYKEKSVQLETTFFSIRDGFALFAANGALLVSNPQYAQLLQLGDVHPGCHFDELFERLRAADVRRSDGQPLTLEPLTQDGSLIIELALPDGHYVELHLNHLPNKGMASMVLDRTSRKDLENKLVHDQKMKAVGHLTGGIAHDFNNLLAVILGNLELLQDSELAPATRQRIERAYRAAERGALLIQRLLAFSRKQSLRPEVVDLTQLVIGLHELMSHSLPANLTITLEIGETPRSAWIDANQLENCLMNLVVNARDAMEERSGAIHIRVFNQRVRRTAGQEQEMVSIEVIDQGCGMAPEVVSRVFEPFFTTKPPGKGSGLGLSMVYGFIRQSGGRVQIDTTRGLGTCIRLQLPCAIDEILPADSELTNDTLPPPPTNHMPLVVVLEDQADVRQTLCDYLHSSGFLTLDCADSAQAMEWITTIEDVRLFISDIVLPGQPSGIEIATNVRSLRPDLAILLVSGHDFSDQHRVIDFPLLMKPYGRHALIKRCCELLAQDGSGLPD